MLEVFKLPGSSVRQVMNLQKQKWLNWERILVSSLQFCHCPGMVIEDRYKQILSQAPLTVKSFSGCLEKLERFGMNRFSQNTEFLIHQAVVLKLLLLSCGAFTKGLSG